MSLSIKWHQGETVGFSTSRASSLTEICVAPEPCFQLSLGRIASSKAGSLHNWRSWCSAQPQRCLYCSAATPIILQLGTADSNPPPLIMHSLGNQGKFLQWSMSQPAMTRVHRSFAGPYAACTYIVGRPCLRAIGR